MEYYLIGQNFELLDQFDLPEDDPDLLILSNEAKNQGMLIVPKHCGNNKKCMKEINPREHKGIYFGEPFVVEIKAYACYLCLFCNKLQDNEME